MDAVATVSHVSHSEYASRAESIYDLTTKSKFLATENGEENPSVLARENEDRQDRQTSREIPSTPVFDRDQSQIQYLVAKLPALAEQFDVHRKIGEGTFSSVFLGTLKNNTSPHARQYAIKHLIPTTLPSRTERELKCLQDIGGKDNVVGIDLCLRNGDCMVFVMPYLPHKRFSDYVHKMGVAETRDYMRNLFIALKRVHSFNIIHRDIKPSNFLYDRDNKRFLLVDFGLAQCMKTDIPTVDSNDCQPLALVKKRKREDDSAFSNTPEMQKKKRMALQPRTDSANLANIAKNEAAHNSRSFGAISAENLKKDIPKIGMSPSMCKAKKDENTPPRRTPKLKQLEGRSPLRDHNRCTAIKKKLFSAGSPNISSKLHSASPKFQSLAPNPSKGTSFVRVQNSQVFTPVNKDSGSAMFSKPTPVRSASKTSLTSTPAHCRCYGKPQVCSICIVRKMQAAPRAGTPGFRPPEVLLKYPMQTTAVDMWAAGIILLCIMSGCYPFFRSPDDLTALAEIMSIFGSEKIKNLALKLGRLVTCSVERGPLDLQKLCERLRQRRREGKPPPGLPTCPECLQLIEESDGCLCLSPNRVWPDKTRDKPEDDTHFPALAYNLLERLLDLNPETRITAEEALEHPFLVDVNL